MAIGRGLLKAGGGLGRLARNRPLLAGLLLAGAAPMANPALAQGTSVGASPGGDQLEQVVVTATRQTSTVNAVPASIAATTQADLDQLGVTELSGLQGRIPSLQIGGISGDNGGQTNGFVFPTIRGISATGDGVAATTGVYLDDTPLQQRNPGTNGRAGGVPIPPLFDLTRIEVLRGPQGTLFGGSAEGGAVRYITPEPSLTTFQAYGRATANTNAYGSPSYETGLAAGGPIIADKLGFRLSVWGGHEGGYLDLVDPATNRVANANANWADKGLLQAKLAYAPNDRARITLGVLGASQHFNTADTAYNESTNGAIAIPTACFNTTVPAGPFPKPVALGAPACVAATGAGRANFTRPGATLGPYELGPGRSLNNLNPASSHLWVGSLTVDYDLGGANFKSITSYVNDALKVNDATTGIIQFMETDYSYAGQTIPRGTPVSNICTYYCLNSFRLMGRNRREGFDQEFRLTSPASDSKLNWVAGVFYSDQRIKSSILTTASDTLMSLPMQGLTFQQMFGTPLAPDSNGVPSYFQVAYGSDRDKELAGFGQIGYWVTSELRLTVGARVSHTTFSFTQDNWGPFVGATPQNYVALGYRNGGSTTETPVTPSVTVQYQFNPRQFLYATVAKGYRPGGANATLPGACNVPLAQYGLTVADIPKAYASDTTWNHELGAKLGLLEGRLQVNGDVYRVNWNNIQTASSLGGCTITYLTNAGTAVSQGFELEVQAIPAHGLTASLSVGYDDAAYKRDAVGVPANPKVPGSQALVVALKGQKFYTPPWTVDLGVRYDFDLLAQTAYVRADYIFQDKITGAGAQTFGVSDFDPDLRYPSTEVVNLRAGLRWGGRTELALFVANAFNSQRGATTSGGRTNCASAACSAFFSYNPILSTSPAHPPRQVGLQLIYRQ